EDEDAFQLTLTAKAQAEAKETTITLKDISVSEGKEDIFLKDTEFQITVDSDEQPENGGGEGVPGEPDETPRNSENETETMQEEPEERPGIASESSEDEEEISKEQEKIRTGDAGGENIIFAILLLISL